MFDLFCYVCYVWSCTAPTASRRETHPRGKTRRAWYGLMFWTYLNQAKGTSTSFLKFICLHQKWSISTCWSDFSFFSLPGKHSKRRRPADDGASERWDCCRYAWSSSCSASCSGAQLERASQWRRSGCDKMWQDVTRLHKRNHTNPNLSIVWFLIEMCRKIEIHLGTRVE